MERTKTKQVKIGNTFLGGNNHILIQSMCNIKTSKVDEVVKQINDCAIEGAELMRVSILDYDDAYAIKEIVSKINIPLIADIHFNYKFALLAIENGASKIRINPGNLKSEDELIQIIEAAKKHHVAIRIGVNGGSLDEKLYEEFPNKPLYFLLCQSALKYINFFENHNFFDLVISLKTSNIIDTIKAYEEFSNLSNYPLHIGLTESGFDEIGIIKSVAALSPLILEGIGNTIRISLTDDPLKEIKTCKRLLHDLGLYPNYPTIISCPTCGRTQVDVKTLAIKTYDYLEKNHINKKVAIMGCIVNGIGEGKNSDIGLAGGKNEYIIFKDGKILKTVKEKDALNELFKELDKMK